MKKGDLTADAIIWFWRIILVTMITIFIFMNTAKYLNPGFETEEFELKILTAKLLYSDTCIKYKNPGEIDLEKFNDAHLQNCYLKSNLGFKLNLTNLDDKQIKVAELLSPQQETDLILPTVSKNFKYLSSKEYVLYYENNELKPGILNIEVIKDVQ